MTTEFDEDPSHKHKEMNGGNFCPKPNIENYPDLDMLEN